MYKRIGEREAIGSMVQSQTPQALAGNRRRLLYLRRHPRHQRHRDGTWARWSRMGRSIRGTHRSLRVVGLDSTVQPYGGELSLRGFVQARTGRRRRSHCGRSTGTALLTGGVNVYTPDWSNAKSDTGQVLYPRPAWCCRVGAQRPQQDQDDPRRPEIPSSVHR